MDELSSKIVLLRESQKAEDFHSFNTTSEPFCDWLNIHEVETLCAKDEAPNGTPKRQISCGNASRSPISSSRRVSACINRRKNDDHLLLKFEHFLDTSCYIQQYRRAKQLKIENAIARLMQEKIKACQNERNLFDKNGQSLSKSPTRVALKPGRSSLQSPLILHSGPVVKPSLPQSGCFSGRKWVHPKDFARIFNKNIGVKCEISKSQQKTPNPQVHNARLNMFLQGTGKPINLSCHKNWMIPSQQRTACKSAPAGRVSLLKQTHNNNMWRTNGAGTPKPSSPQKELLNCTNLNSMFAKQSVTQPRTNLQPSQSSQFYVKGLQKSACSNAETIEYEKMFRHIFDFYEHSSKSKLHVPIDMSK